MKRRDFTRMLGVQALGVQAFGAAALRPGQARAATPVRIGVLSDLAGPLANISGVGVVSSVKMAVQDFGNTVNGAPIEVVVADMSGGVDLGVAIARRWYDEGVDVIVDIPNSAIALAVQDIARDKHRNVLFTGAGSSELTGRSCSPFGFQWTFDTYALAAGSAASLIAQGSDSWFFLTVDYAFGTSLEANAVELVNAHGGTVVGSVRFPPDTTDFSSFLVRAQASKAKVVGLSTTTSGAETIIKQAHEFGLGAGGQKVAALVLYISDVHSLGLEVAQGTLLEEAYYWDQNPAMRAFGERFFALNKRMPGMTQAGPYSAVTHYLKAVQAVAGTDAALVSKAMKAMPINDFMTTNGVLREDGRVQRDMYLYRVKSPAESHKPWDYYELVRIIPAAEATRPLGQGGCKLGLPG